MRSMLECLHQEMPPEMEARTFGDELVQRFGVSEDKVNKLVDLCNQAEKKTAAHIMSLPKVRLA